MIDAVSSLPADVLADVREALAESARADGRAAVSEDGMLRLARTDSAGLTHLVARTESGGLAGYAQLTVTDDEAAAELTVRPAERGHGLGRELLSAVVAAAESGRASRLDIWSHGGHPATAALAASQGLEPTRSLFQMRMPMNGDGPEAEPVAEQLVRAGYELRPFQVGADEEGWLRLNAGAFADHPEQGRLTLDDLLAREAAPWFDAAGFLLADRVTDGALAGFHWTKAHPATEGNPETGVAPEPALGEVYVLGIAPWAQGTGLAGPLTIAGLRHLYDAGLRHAMLYVDESNVRAVKLYQRLGFTLHSTDIQFSRAFAG